MFSDVLGIPVSVPRCREAGALGAAIAAGVGVGIFPDLLAGVRRMARSASRFAPDRGMTSHYDGRYLTFSMITEAMRPVWRRMAEET
jgi:L-xylulokinase